jgi:hypothetical protein
LGLVDFAIRIGKWPAKQSKLRSQGVTLCKEPDLTLTARTYDYSLASHLSKTTPIPILTKEKRKNQKILMMAFEYLGLL